MKNKCTNALVLAVIVSMFSVSVVPVYAESGNQADVEISKMNFYWTDEDNIENIPIVWSSSWFTNMRNTPDSGLPVTNPKVILQTDLNFVKFYPNDPSVFTAQPELGLYTWDFKPLELLETVGLPLSAFTSDETLISKPRFTASRSVVPETLTDDVTEQTVTLTLKFEDPLPFEVNGVNIHMGANRIAYEQYPLVEGQFVSMVPVADWRTDTDGVGANWYTNPSNIEIGKTYTFQGTLRSIKSPLLSGSPIFIPGIKVGYDRNIQNPMETSNSITIADPDNTISASFSADNLIDWTSFYSDNRFDFWFGPRVSQIIPDEPPFYVLTPANVQIEPDTLNLKSNGEWITAYIEFPEVYEVKNIVVSSITLKTPSGEVHVDPIAPATVGDYDSDSVSDLMVKFDRSTVIGQMGANDVVVDDGTGIDQQFEFKVVGQLVDETKFEGTDKVWVIKKRK